MGRVSIGGDNDREGLNNHDKEGRMFWGTWSLLSRPDQLDTGELILVVLEVGLEFQVSLILVFEIV